AQALADVVGGLPVVFDEKDLHGVAQSEKDCHPDRSEGSFRFRRRGRIPRCARDDREACAASASNPGQTQRSPTIQTFNAAAMRAPWPQPHIRFAKSPRRRFPQMTKTKTILAALGLTTALTAPALIAPLFTAPSAIAAAPIAAGGP